MPTLDTSGLSYYYLLLRHYGGYALGCVVGSNTVSQFQGLYAGELSSR